MKDGALIGLHAGTPVNALRDNGQTLHVAWQGLELDVDKKILSNDLNVVRAAVANDRQAQHVIASWMTQQQQAVSAQKAQEEQRITQSPAVEIEKTKQPTDTSSESDGNAPDASRAMRLLLEATQRQVSRNPLERPAYNETGPKPPNREAQKILESLQPKPANPLDSGAHNKTATFTPRETDPSDPLSHQIKQLDYKIRNAENLRKNTTNRTPQQIEAEIAALKAERDTLYRLYRVQKDLKYQESRK